MPEVSENSFKIKHSLQINREDGSYNLLIECQYGMEMICFEGDLKLEIVDLDSTIATISESPLTSNI